MGLDILMLLDNPFTNDSRVLREANTLVEAGFNLKVVCMEAPGLPKEENVNGIRVFRILPEALKDPKAIGLNNKVARMIVNSFNFDVLHCHDQFMLHLGSKIKKQANRKTTLIYDSHELFHAWPLNVDTNGWLVRQKSAIVRRFQIFREKHNRKSIDYLITVNQSLAEDLNKYLQLRKKPVVLRNIPEFPEAFQTNTVLREKLNIPLEDKLLVFIGGNIYPKTLNLEQVINEFGNKSGVHLAFICSDRPGKKAIEGFVYSKGYKNIHFHGLIKPEEIPSWLSSADAGLVPTWNKNDLSYWYALDNKLFEYMMSEIPILATQQPEYKRVIEEFQIGVCVNPDEPNAYWNGFQELLERRTDYVQKIREAKLTLNWEVEKGNLLELYQTILKSGS